MWGAVQTGSIINGPSKSFMTRMFGSALFTDIVGVHVIFGFVRCAVTEPFTGAFVVGLIIPRQGSLAIALTEKLEDVVSIIFLPLVYVPDPPWLYLWLTSLIVLHTAYVGKFGGCFVAARIYQHRDINEL